MSSVKWLLPLLAAAALAGEPSPEAIVKRSLERDLIDFDLARNYTFTEHTLITKVDGKGNTKEKESQTREIFFLYGEPYEKLVQKNGKPLDANNEKKERERLERLTRERERETPEQRRKRLAKFEKERDEFRTLRQEIGKAYDWKLRGSEVVGGRDTWVLDASPKAGYKGVNFQSRMLPKIKGVLWVSKQDYHWVKADCQSLDTISFGLFLARLAKGAKIAFESTKINEELWLPKRFYVSFETRLALMKSIRANIEQQMTNYRKFQTESRITNVSESP